ncbi:MAG: HAMP domain-containing sensor histidine kinase [Pseudomonadota bacterium]
MEILNRITGGRLLVAVMVASALVAALFSAAVWTAGQSAQTQQLKTVETQILSMLRDQGLGRITQMIDNAEAAGSLNGTNTVIAVWRGIGARRALLRVSDPGLTEHLERAGFGLSQAQLSGIDYLVSRPDIAALSASWTAPVADTDIVLALRVPTPELVAARRTIISIWGGFLLALAVGVLLHLNHRKQYQTSLQRMTQELDRFSSGDTQVRMADIDTPPELVVLSAQLNSVLDRIEGLVSGLRYLAAHAAHELKTPLQHILSDLEPLAQSADALDRSDRADHMRQTVDKANARLNALMQLFRLEADADIALQPGLDLGALCDLAWDDYLDLYDAKGCNAVITLEPDVRVTADRQLMTLLLDNLLGNAAKYAPDGAQIRLDLSRTQSGFVLSVSNTGGAFPADIRDYAFDRFARARDTADRPGTGLGLSLVHVIAERHGFRARIKDDDSCACVEISGAVE